jgi:hypothetical protein
MRLEGPFVIDDDGQRVFGAPAKLPEVSRSSCRSAADGSFEFADLDRGSLYRLTARGLGWLLVEPLAQVAPSEEPRTLAVRRVYVARVLAADEEGKPPASECQYLRYARVAGPGECESVPVGDSPANALRDIRLPPANGAEPVPEGRSYSFASDCDAARLGPFRMLVCCAGFERQDFEFWAYPEEQHADTTLLRLQRTAAPAGLLRVQQDCGCDASFCEHLLEGRIELEPADGAQKPLTFELTGLVREQSFRDIPSGTWRVRARARFGGFCHPAEDAAPLEISIGEAPALLCIPVEKLGAIRWKLRGPGDQLASEGLAVLWRGERGAESSAQLWMSVVMRGLEAGPQSFEFDGARYANVEGARYAPSGTKARLEVDVRPGATQTVVVHTP